MPVDSFVHRPPLTARTKFSYGLGSVASGTATAALSGAILQFYLNQVLGLPALLVGTAIMVSLMVDAVVDLVIGQWSDKTRTSWGRRHPFMYASVLPAGVTFWLLWNAPASVTGTSLVVFMLLLMIAVRISVSLFEIPGNALTPELTPDYDQRTTLQSYRWFFGILGGAALPLILNLGFLAKSVRNPLGNLSRQGYADWAIIAAAAMVVSILISAIGTHDQIRYLPQLKRTPKTLRESLREIGATLANRSLVALLLGGILGGVGAGLRNGLMIYLYSDYWGLDPKQYGLLLPLGALGSILAVFLAPPLARRFGKKPAMIGLFVISVFVFSAPIGLRLIGLMPANGSPWIMPILAVDGIATAIVAVVGFVLVGSMMADVVEDAAVKTGVRSEGLLYATSGLLVKFTGGIGAFVAGWLLTIVHFPVHALMGTVSPDTMRRLVIYYLPINAAFSFASIAVLSLYRIDRASHERNLAALAQADAIAQESRGLAAVESGQATAT